MEEWFRNEPEWRKEELGAIRDALLANPTGLRYNELLRQTNAKLKNLSKEGLPSSVFDNRVKRLLQLGLVETAKVGRQGTIVRLVGATRNLDEDWQKIEGQKRDLLKLVERLPSVPDAELTSLVMNTVLASGRLLAEAFRIGIERGYSERVRGDLLQSAAAGLYEALIKYQGWAVKMTKKKKLLLSTMDAVLGIKVEDAARAFVADKDRTF